MRLVRVGLCRSMYSFAGHGWLHRRERGLGRGRGRADASALSPQFAGAAAVWSREAACGQGQ